MITSSSDNKLRKQVLDFVSPRANIHHSLNDGFSFIAYLDEDKIIGGAIFSHYDGHNIWMHLGFVKEGTIRKVVKKGMQYFDGIVYGLLRNECKYI